MSTRRKLIQVSGGAAALAIVGRAALAGAQDASPEAVAIGDISVLPLKEAGSTGTHPAVPKVARAAGG